MEEFKINLTLFGDGGDGAGGAASAGADGGQGDLGSMGAGRIGAVADGPQDEEAAAFDAFISDHRQEYDRRMQTAIKSRLKGSSEKVAQLDALQPVLSLLSERYGVQGNDAKALLEALEDDTGYLEEEALEKGLSVENLKEFKRLERENAQFRAMTEDRQRQQQVNEIYSKWSADAEVTKQLYPDFDLNEEITNPTTGARYSDLLKAGVDVRTAYEVVHRDELIGGALQYTAQRVAQKTVNDIKARGMRPSENGAGGQGASRLTRTDPSKLTRAEREAISRRVMQGERVQF